jgi:hypothetical protein
METKSSSEVKSNPLGIESKIFTNPNHKVSAPEQKRPLSGVKELVSSFTPQSTGTHFRHLYVSGAVAMPAYIVIRLGRAAGGQPGTTSQLGVN